MAKTRKQKEDVVKKIEKGLEEQKAIYFVDFAKAKASQLAKLRNELKKSDALLYIVKKRLADIALKKKKIPIEMKDLKGQIAFVFGTKDEIAPAKTLYEFETKNKNPEIIGAYLEEAFMAKEKVIELAKLPGRQELFGKLVNTLKSPAYGLANAMRYNLKGLVYILSNIKSN
jgi:large subunit ribosomal protein L10